MRGNMVMKGYYKNPKATAEAFKGGWFRSGDIAFQHPDGYIKITDRAKDIIISGGENVSSVEVEGALMHHPAVSLCAVVAKPDDKWGEVPCAFVELKPGATATEADLIAFAANGWQGSRRPSTWSLPTCPKPPPARSRNSNCAPWQIEDALMIGAIETVRGAIAKSRARPGRLRAGVIGAGVVLVLVLTLFWLPRALIAQTAAMVPASKRAEIGRMALADVTRVTGIPCAQPLGLQAAERLADRVLGKGGGQILFLRDGVQTATHLPGDIILLSRRLVEDQDGPDVAAGFALAEKLRAGLNDPLIPLLRHAGLVATFRLLTSGTLPDDTLSGYAEAMLPAGAMPLPDALVLDAFRQASLATSPYAFALDPSGEAVLGLIEADPYRTEAPLPVLPDGDWISLQAICQEE
jgi:hypothetical protein